MKMMRKLPVLFVGDDASTTDVLKDDYELVIARDEAEAAEKIAQSLKNDEFFELVILDLSFCNGEIGRKILDVIGSVNILVLAELPDDSKGLSFSPDGVIIKPFNRETLVSLVERLTFPIRFRRSEEDSVLLNHWLAASRLSGFSEAVLHSEVFGDDGVRKLTLETSNGEFINCVVYEQPEVEDGVINIGVSPMIGCPIKCRFCKNWRRSGSQGRQLTQGEIMAQVYFSLIGERDIFSGKSRKKVVVNFTVEGDALFNLESCAEAIRQISGIKKPEVSFIITSVGKVESLERFVFNYLDLPRTKHYWSVISLIPEVREKLMPGTKDQSLEKTRDLYEIIARNTGQKITVSWTVIKGVNDRQEDAEMLAKFFGGRPFEIKLMALCEGSLPGVSTSDEDVELFGQCLRELNVPFRIRKILGKNIQSGCGNTQVSWLGKK